jgi:hypothetical protein
MELHGIVRDGLIVLDTPQILPEGVKVKVLLEEPPPDQSTLLNLLKHAGTLPDMPSDFAEQHDHYIHYIHGTPKR